MALWQVAPNRGSNELQPLHAGMSVATDDDVIVHGDGEPLAGFDNVSRNDNVLPAGLGIAARMIVHQ